MNSDIQKEVIRQIGLQLGLPVDEIKPEMEFTKDLGADSLDIIELIMNLEEANNISIPEEFINKESTVQAVIDFLQKRTTK